jgi:hypothetical protein
MNKPLVTKTMIDRQFKLLQFNHYWFKIHIYVHLGTAIRKEQIDK